MALGYIFWSVFAMISYSFVFLFGKLAMQEIPPFTVMCIASVFPVLTGAAIMLWTGDLGAISISPKYGLWAVLTGITLAGAVAGYFQALSTGPASIVVPIYGMFIVGGSLLAILFLGESLTTKKALGIVFATVSVWLIAT